MIFLGRLIAIILQKWKSYILNSQKEQTGPVLRTENPLFRHASVQRAVKKVPSSNVVRRTNSSVLRESTRKQMLEKSPSTQEPRRALSPVTRVRSHTAYARGDEAQRKGFYSHDVDNTNDKLASLNLMSTDAFYYEDLEGLEEESNTSNDASRIDFFACMRDEPLSNLFWCFLREIYQQEKLSFWLAVEDYRSISEIESRKKRAQEMLEKYFVLGSEYQVPVDPEVSNYLYQSVENSPTHELFDSIQDEVTSLLSNIYFPRFMRSELFARFLGKNSQ